MTLSFIRIPVELLSLKELERTQLMILALALAFGNEGLKLSNNELSRLLKVKRRNIIKAINGLRDNGHLNGDCVSGQNRRLVVSGKIARMVVSEPTLLESEGSDERDTGGSVEIDTKVVSRSTPITEEQKNKQKNKRKGERAPSGFEKPTSEEVRAYASEIGYDRLNGEVFVDYYTSCGWRVGRNPMRDWKAVVRNWRARDKKQGGETLSEQFARMEKEGQI